jgi:hypothetical protein
MRNILVKLKFFYILTKWCISEQVTISRDPLTGFCLFLHFGVFDHDNFSVMLKYVCCMHMHSSHSHQICHIVTQQFQITYLKQKIRNKR